MNNRLINSSNMTCTYAYMFRVLGILQASKNMFVVRTVAVLHHSPTAPSKENGNFK